MDTSALVSILLEEEDATDLSLAILAADRRLMSAASWVEAALVFDGRTRQDPAERLDRVISELGITVVPFDASQALAARDASRRYGGRPARLNFGDCMAYATAKLLGEPLLYKGGDFAQTDIAPALA